MSLVTFKMGDFITSKPLRKILALDLMAFEKRNQQVLFSNQSNYSYLLIGPKESGRTSLLFEYAFQYVDNGDNVLYITQNRLEKLPNLISREKPSVRKLKRIELYYPSTTQEFFRLLNSIHLQKNSYQLVIIDNFDHFYLPYKKDIMKMAAKLCAFIVDAVSYLSLSR